MQTPEDPALSEVEARDDECVRSRAPAVPLVAARGLVVGLGVVVWLVVIPVVDLVSSLARRLSPRRR